MILRYCTVFAECIDLRTGQYGWSKAILLLPGAKLAECWCSTSECLNAMLVFKCKTVLGS